MVKYLKALMLGMLVVIPPAVVYYQTVLSGTLASPILEAKASHLGKMRTEPEPSRRRRRWVDESGSLHQELVDLSEFLKGKARTLPPRVAKVCGMQDEQRQLFKEMEYNVGSIPGYGEFKHVEREEKHVKYLLSLHNPQEDAVVSKGILMHLFSPEGTYPSVTEVHALCDGVPSLGPQGSRGEEEDEKGTTKRSSLISCSPGKTAVEVGSSIGMISMYLAARGMKVHALDPVQPNLQRLNESICLNSFRNCLRSSAPDGRISSSSSCFDSSALRSFAGRVKVHHSLVASSSGDRLPVQTQPRNLASTLPTQQAGATYSAMVKTIALDDIEMEEVELLHVTSQVKNVVFMMYFLKDDEDGREQEIQDSLKSIRFLRKYGFSFYNIEGCGRAQRGFFSGPALIPWEQVEEYVKKPRETGAHPTILASRTRVDGLNQVLQDKLNQKEEKEKQRARESESVN
ncbi:hypothetical protein GUITHDRAFT_141080 [Guillardia theta CCMP2712]|uniref:Uncharacterized protein n=1 Tax=Guillardia theta (strain CCMP2712) TaxID=905079 RepID=L1J2C9_GUITC|nr:hypothetical protein GUITHDRAFT_141080 [Guillardia theta CCMP2712]EKX42681.1 hypothetical protein GUITHDRAFT_141080 [Guillardia theta CCMP2712]|eukprot:XP_005829661.1 hypothetical protein GUITHDRAFT_141080 [Guillardia theta CCMP2712]